MLFKGTSDMSVASEISCCLIVKERRKVEDSPWGFMHSKRWTSTACDEAAVKRKRLYTIFVMIYWFVCASWSRTSPAWSFFVDT